MKVIKVACPKCAQKVSGDESFFGTSVTCPVCTAEIAFPAKGTDPETVDATGGDDAPEAWSKKPPEEVGNLPTAFDHDGLNDTSPQAARKLPSSDSAEEIEVDIVQDPRSRGNDGQTHLPAIQGQGGMPPYPHQPMPGPGHPGGFPYGHPGPHIGRDTQKDYMPAIVFGAGIFSFLTAFCVIGILFGIVTIIIGHTTMMRLTAQENQDKSAAGKSNVTVGLIMGYTALLIGLGAIFAYKHFGVIQKIKDLFGQGAG